RRSIPALLPHAYQIRFPNDLLRPFKRSAVNRHHTEMNTPIHRLLVAVVAIFHFSQAAAATDPPWAVAPQVVINEQPLKFTSAGAQLSGTLYYPEGRKNLGAVVVFHAAAEPSQDAALYTHLKQMLPPLGIAVFV